MKPKLRYQPGDKIGGRYQVHQALMGGMGEVYLCLDLETIQPFALKTFQQRYLTNLKLRKAFENEVATWVALEKHSNIVRCYYMDFIDNQPFMFLEWIAGEEGRGTDLRSWPRRGLLDLRTALDFTIDICRGLIHAQEKQPGIVHRDLKPENILITKGRLAKISDFGLTQIVQTAELEITNEDEMTKRRSLLGQDGFVGTPPYMAPEQWRGETLDARTDIYALGCILYELLTGNPPFMATTLDSFRRQHLEADIPRLSSGQVGTSALDALLIRCLTKQPETRIARVDDLVQQVICIYQQEFAVPPKAHSFTSEFGVIDYANRGLTYDKLQLYDNALADYNQAIALDPALALTYSNRGNTYLNLQRYDDALADHNQAIQLDPTLAHAYASRGNVYNALQQYNHALADYNQAIQLEPTSALIHSNRGGTYINLQQYDNALTDLGQAIQLDPSLTLVYTNRGTTFLHLQRYDEALADFSRVIQLDPTNASAYINRGKTYAKLKRYHETLADLSQAIQLDPNYTQAYSNRGETYAILQRYDAALVDFSRAIQLDPKDATIYINRGITNAKLQRYNDAIADLNWAIELDPKNSQTFYNRGNIHVELRQYEKALTDYSQAIQVDRNNVMAYANRGNVYADFQQFDEAYTNRGLTYSKLQRYDKVLADYNQAIMLKPNEATAHYNRGIVYDKLQLYEKALTDYNQAIRLNPTLTQAYISIGIILGVHHKWQESLPYFEKAAQLGDPQGVHFLAQVKQILGSLAELQTNSHQIAFEAFQGVKSVNELYEAVAAFPFMTDINFITAIEQVIAEQVPLEHHPLFEQHLTWLRQIAAEQQGKERNP